MTTNAAMLAQGGMLSGIVSLDGEVTEFATVYLDGTNYGVETDSNGHYQMEGISPGDYLVIAGYVGAVSRKARISIVENESVVVNFDLVGAALMEEVVVTGTMKPTYILESPIKVEALSSRQLDVYMPSAASSVVDAVTLVNGVQEVVACGVCFTNSISINGLEGAYTAVLMDGMPMYGSLASVYGLNGIPNLIIDRVEVIRGPNSTLYGSEAVAGVINIITRNPGNEPALSLDIMGTTHNELFLNAAVAPRIGNTSGYIGLNYGYSNIFEDQNEDSFGDIINLDRYSLFTKWNISRPSGKAFTVAGKIFYEDRRNGVQEFLEDRAYRELRGNETIYGESIYTNRLELFGTYELDVLPDIRIDYSFSRHSQDSYYGADHYVADQNIAFSNLLYSINSGKHDILAGPTLRYQGYDDNTVATEEVLPDSTVSNRPDNQFIPGVFVQDEFRANDRWTILAGARLDHYKRHGAIFSPRLNIKYKPSEWTTLRANFGTGFRIVNLFTEDHAFITGQREVVIEETLEPETSYNASLSSSFIYTLGNGTGTIDVDGYYTYFTNKIIPDYSEPGKIIYANSDGHARTMGIGANISYGFAFPLQLSVGFNIQEVTQTEPNDQGVMETTDIEFAPAWTGVITANYKWQKINTTFAYSAQLTGPMKLPEVYDLDENGAPLPNPRPTKSEPFSIHNIQITTKLNNAWSIYCGLSNIFNYIQPSSPLVAFDDPNTSPGFSDLFDTAYAFGPVHGREFYLGVKFNLAAR